MIHVLFLLLFLVVPQVFVVAKGLCWVDGGECGVGVENGVVIGVRKLGIKDNVYINYNRWQQQCQHNPQPLTSSSSTTPQLILSYTGNPQPSTYPLPIQQILPQLCEVYKLAIQDLSIQKIKGGLIYINSKLQDNKLYQKQALILAFFVSILVINQIHHQYTIQDVIGKLRKYLKQGGKMEFKESMEKYFGMLGCGNNQYLMNGNIINLEYNNRKLIISKLNSNNKYLDTLIQHQHSQLNKTNTKNICLLDLMTQMHTFYKDQINSKQLNLQQPIYKCLLHSQGFFFCSNSEYVVIILHSSLVAEVVRILSNQMRMYGVQYNGDAGKDVLEGKSKGKGRRGKGTLDNVLFSTLPSVMLSIMNPQDQIWFHEST